MGAPFRFCVLGVGMRWLLAGVLCLVMSFDSWSYGTTGKTLQTVYTCSVGGQSGSGISAAAACATAAQAASAYSEGNKAYDGQGQFAWTLYEYAGVNTDGNILIKHTRLCSVAPGWNITCNNNQVLGTYAYSAPATQTQSCRENSSEQADGSCKCFIGFRPDAGGNCTPYSCQAGAMGQDSGFGPYPGSALAMAKKSWCVSGAGGGANGGCEGVLEPTSAKCGSDGMCWGVGRSGLSGRYCDSPPPVNPVTGAPVPPGEDKGTIDNAPPSPCSSGQCPGSVNGSSVCVPCSFESAKPSSSTASAPSGGTAPNVGGVPGAQGSSTSSTCYSGSSASGTCISETTFYGAGGQVVGSTSTEKTKGEFCAENKGSPLCTGGAFGGSCGAFTCDGDGVQCAIAKEQHQRNCEFFGESQLSSSGADAMNGQATPDGHPRGVSTEYSMGGRISTADLLPGGGCLSDLVVSVGGASLTVPFSVLCPHLAMLGNIVQGFAMLAALGIVFRS